MDRDARSFAGLEAIRLTICAQSLPTSTDEWWNEVGSGLPERTYSHAIIIDSSSYSIDAATPRHLEALSIWIAAQCPEPNHRPLLAAAVVRREMMIEAAQMVAIRVDLLDSWTWFADRRAAYRWVLRSFLLREDVAFSVADFREGFEEWRAG